MKFLVLLGFVLAIGGAVFGLMGFWIWALHGMDENVGLAWVITTFVVVLGGIEAVIVAASMDE